MSDKTHFSSFTLWGAPACLFVAGAMGANGHDGGIGFFVLLAVPFLVLLSVPAGIVDVVRCRDRQSKVQLSVAVALVLIAVLVR